MTRPYPPDLYMEDETMVMSTGTCATVWACDCHEEENLRLEKEEASQAQFGWICPRCGQVWSPHIWMCTSCKPPFSTSATSDTVRWIASSKASLT